jgi:thymidylate synthase
MNKLDKDYQRLLEDILDNGVKKNTRNGEVLSVFGRTIRHSMKDGFSLLTTKKMHFKGIVAELLWFLKGATNIHYLLENNCNIWTGDAYKAYTNYFKGHEDVPSIEWFSNEILNNIDFANKWGELGPIYGAQWRGRLRGYGFNEITGEPLGYGIDPKLDQIQNLINDLKTNPDSRRLLVSAWSVSDLPHMTLPPCHYSFQVWTRELTDEERLMWLKQNSKVVLPYRDPNTDFSIDEFFRPYGVPKRAISLMFNMRSNDVPLGLPFNIASYALLLEIIARMVNMVPDEVIANLGDAHIYQNQIDGVKEQLSREPYELPKLEINDGIKFDGSIDDVLNSCIISDFKIKNYQSHPSIKMPLSN